MEQSELTQGEIDAIDAIELTAEDEADIDEALRNARDPLNEEVVLSAHYDAGSDCISLILKTGQRLFLPREELQGLADAKPELVSKVEIEMLGKALHWEELNVDHLVDHLRRGFYGSARWMAQLGERRRGNLAVS